MMIHLFDKSGSYCGLSVFNCGTRKITEATCPKCLVTNKAERIRLEYAKQLARHYSSKEKKLKYASSDGGYSLFSYFQGVAFNKYSQRLLILSPVFDFSDFSYFCSHLWIRDDKNHFSKLEKIKLDCQFRIYKKSNGKNSFQPVNHKIERFEDFVLK